MKCNICDAFFFSYVVFSLIVSDTAQINGAFC